LLLLAVCACVLASSPTQAGNQKEERLAASIRAALHQAVSDAPPTIAIEDIAERDRWLTEMSLRLEKRIPDPNTRKELLTTVHYEATRAGLDPQLVLGLIQIESRFRKYALSKAGARGYMQVMPFWIEAIGNKEDNLFHMRTNLRYGCTILRHYIDLEKGNLFMALGRYNGSRGKPEYPNLVYAVWHKHWTWTPSQTPTQVATASPSPASAAPAVPATVPAAPAAPATVPAAPAAASKPPPVVAALDKPASEPPPALKALASANKPPAALPQTAVVTPAPVPAPPQAAAPSPEPHTPVRRDIVIVR